MGRDPLNSKDLGEPLKLLPEALPGTEAEVV